MELDVIHNKSCEKMDEVEDASIDLLITSPPYDVGLEYEKEILGLEKYKDFTLRWMNEGKRVLKSGGRMCINIAATGRKPYAPLPDYYSVWGVEDVGLLHRGVVAWYKIGRRGDSTAWGSWMSPSSPFLRDTTEMIEVFMKKGDVVSDNLTSMDVLRKVLMTLRDPINDAVLNEVICLTKENYKKSPSIPDTLPDITKNAFMRDTVSFWEVSSRPQDWIIMDDDQDDVKDVEVRESTSVWKMRCETSIKWHPAPFPVELPKRLIQLFSFPGDVVLDTFGGSGQTAIACVTLPQKRHYILYELNADYCRLARKRIRSVDLKKLTDFL